ncbi:MAG: hypothetical protein CME17_07045 [Gemmatimonadetes bacterium]|nr:hypothetical protein [Gemmatimonadota bacterium]
MGGLGDTFHIVGQALGQSCLLQVAAGEQNGSQGVVDLMGNAGGQLSDGRQTALLVHLRKHPVAFRDFPQDIDSAQQTAALVPHWG